MEASTQMEGLRGQVRHPRRRLVRLWERPKGTVGTPGSQTCQECGTSAKENYRLQVEPAWWGHLQPGFCSENAQIFWNSLLTAIVCSLDVTHRVIGFIVSLLGLVFFFTIPLFLSFQLEKFTLCVHLALCFSIGCGKVPGAPTYPSPWRGHFCISHTTGLLEISPS